MELLWEAAGGMDQQGLSNVWRDPCLCLPPQCTSLLGKGNCICLSKYFSEQRKNENFSSENSRGGLKI